MARPRPRRRGFPAAGSLDAGARRHAGSGRAPAALIRALTGYRIAGVDDVVAPADVIRFDSPIPGVLDVGGRTLAAALELEDAARRLAAVELPAGTLKNRGHGALRRGGGRARRRISKPRAANPASRSCRASPTSARAFQPADLQLIEARANVATDVARLFNVPVAMIGASPSGNASALLYSNLSQQLAILVSCAVAPHLRTVELTLSDVYPRGTSVAFDVQTFLRSDPQAAADYATGYSAPALSTSTEARSLLGIPSHVVAAERRPNPGRG